MLIHIVAATLLAGGGAQAPDRLPVGGPDPGSFDGKWTIAYFEIGGKTVERDPTAMVRARGRTFFFKMDGRDHAMTVEFAAGNKVFVNVRAAGPGEAEPVGTAAPKTPAGTKPTGERDTIGPLPPLQSGSPGGIGNRNSQDLPPEKSGSPGGTGNGPGGTSEAGASGKGAKGTAGKTDKTDVRPGVAGETGRLKTYEGVYILSREFICISLPHYVRPGETPGREGPADKRTEGAGTAAAKTAPGTTAPGGEVVGTGYRPQPGAFVIMLRRDGPGPGR